MYAVCAAVYGLLALEVSADLGIAMLLLWAAALLGTVLWARRQRRIARDRHDLCGGCLQVVDDVSSGVCPSCGRKLDEVGIQTSTPTLSRRSKRFAIIWTAIFLLGAYPILSLVGIDVSCRWPRDCPNVRGLTSTTPGLSLISVAVLRPPDAPRAGIARLFIRDLGRGLIVDLETLTFLEELGDDRSASVGQTPFSSSAFLAWLKDAGVNSDDPAVQLDVEDLVRLLERLARGQTWDEASAGVSRFQIQRMVQMGPPEPWYWEIAVPAWVLLWLCGIWIGVRRRWPTATLQQEGS